MTKRTKQPTGRAPQRRKKRTVAAVAASLPPLPNPDDEQAFLDWLGLAKTRRAKAKAGTPWTAEEFLHVFLLAGTGMKIKAIAHVLGRSAASINQKFMSQIKWAVEAGRAKTDKELSSLLVESARKARYDPKYLTALIFYLKTQCGWSERFTLGMEKELKEMLQVGMPAQAVVGRLAAMDSDDLRQLAVMLDRVGAKATEQPQEAQQASGPTMH